MDTVHHYARSSACTLSFPELPRNSSKHTLRLQQTLEGQTAHSLRHKYLSPVYPHWCCLLLQPFLVLLQRSRSQSASSRGPGRFLLRDQKSTLPSEQQLGPAFTTDLQTPVFKVLCTATNYSLATPLGEVRKNTPQAEFNTPAWFSTQLLVSSSYLNRRNHAKESVS